MQGSSTCWIFHEWHTTVPRHRPEIQLGWGNGNECTSRIVVYEISDKYELKGFQMHECQ